MCARGGEGTHAQYVLFTERLVAGISRASGSAESNPTIHQYSLSTATFALRVLLGGVFPIGSMRGDYCAIIA